MVKVRKRQRSAFGDNVNRRRKSISKASSSLKPKSPSVSFYHRKHLSIKNKINGLSTGTKLYMCRIFAKVKNRVFKRLYIVLLKWKFTVGLGFFPSAPAQGSKQSNKAGVQNKKRPKSPRKHSSYQKWPVLMINRPYVKKKLQLCAEAMYHDKNKHCIIKFWYKWKTFKYKKKLFHLSKAAAIKFYRRRCKLKFMKRWIRYVKLRLVARKMFCANTSKTMSKCFVAWSRHSIKSHFERQTSSRHNAICMRFLHSLLRKTTVRCFKKWKRFSIINRRSRYLITRVIKRMDNPLLAMGFKAWWTTRNK